MNGDRQQSEKKEIPSLTLAGDDVALFLAAKENYVKFLALLESGIFSIDFGQAQVNVHDGHIQSIYVNRRTYADIPIAKKPPML